MLPLLFKADPVFDIRNDIEQIRMTIPSDDPEFVQAIKLPRKSNIARMPVFRAYILTKQLQPLAIFDRLGYEDLEAFIKIGMCMRPKHIDNPKRYRDVEVMNQGKKLFFSKAFKKPYKIALFMADKIQFHASIPVDLMIYLCARFHDLDIVERGIWSVITGEAEPD
ncbi:MAG TPA: hypothetical protein HPP94_08780 [Desulfuromonadales bacterium]|nr:hypothetical protein [Desulfuromonadales bacterium]